MKYTDGLRTSSESYMHKAAKIVFAGWLRKAAKKAGHDNYADMAGIYWRVNRSGPHFGVWEEYPFLENGGANGCVSEVWDESGEPNGKKHLGQWRDLDGREHEEWFDEYTYPWENRPPTYRELTDRNIRPAAIVDIAIQHKGWIITAVEIKHKHGLSQEKIDFLDEKVDLQHLLEVPAEWVLNQLGSPERIPERFWVFGGPR